ncbi:MAG: hypothetical protein K2X54_07790 [Methylobacterium organophilum]|nr:hypothetical protein [Methylobacterium organophilum]
MTDPTVITLIVATIAAAVMIAGSLVASKRSAARIDRMVAEREAADHQRKKADDDADRLLKDNLIRTR